MGLSLLILLIIIFVTVFSAVTYCYQCDLKDLKEDYEKKIKCKDEYISQLISEMRSKEYEIDELRGYKSY